MLLSVIITDGAFESYPQLNADLVEHASSTTMLTKVNSKNS